VATNVHRLSTAQLLAGRTAAKTEYIQYECLRGGTPSENLNPPTTGKRSWPQH